MRRRRWHLTTTVWTDSLDSMEGVPEWPRPKEHPTGPKGGTLSDKGHAVFAWIGLVLPGLVLAAAVAIAGGFAARWIGTGLLGFARSPISDISVAVLIGLLIRNTFGLPDVYEKGVRLCSREVLRIGIVLLGLKLGLAEAGALGLMALPVILVCIVAALFIVTRLGSALGLPARLGGLIAVGTSICGVSAIAATAPVIDAEEDEISYAVACVTLFGLSALFVYPFVAHGLFGAAPRLAGIFLGTAIHDTSQVAGAALMYQQQFQAPEALGAATVTKLMRNLCMVGVIPLIGARFRAAAGAAAGAGSARAAGAASRPAFLEMVPLFVVGFVGAVVLRTVGDLGPRAFGILDRPAWADLLHGGEVLATWCLTIAMASIGLGTSLSRIRKLGARPFFVGLLAAVLVGGVSATLLLGFAAAR